MNSMSRTPLRVRHPLRVRTARVVQVDSLSPRMRRIVFAGEDFKDFTSSAADDHVKLILPAQSLDEAAFLSLLKGEIKTLASHPSLALRDYTPRRFDAAKGELALEFVLHGDGPASLWASQARPGQWAGIAGPRGSFLVPEDYAYYLLAGDETALPAIARRLEEMPLGMSADVLIEVADESEERVLPTIANARIRWVHRRDRASGTVGAPGSALLTALRYLTLPASDIHVWIAAEIETARQLRRYLIEEEGVAREHIRAAGYWRYGAINGGERLED